MAVVITAKRASCLLDERAKARLAGYASSGSEHEADDSCLSSLVNALFDLDETAHTEVDSSKNATTDDDSDGSSIAHALEVVHDLLYLSGKCDHLGRRLQSDVAMAAEAFLGLKLNESGYRRVVMARLREKGYNAGICKARWEGSVGLIAGNYEYIDIVVDKNSNERCIIDLNFAAQFEIARATANYERLVESLPIVTVARAEEVR